MSAWEVRESEHLVLRVIEHRSKLRKLLSKVIRNDAPLFMRRLRRLLRKGGVDERENHLTLTFIRERQSVAHEMHPASLPRRVKDLRDCCLQAEMRVRNYQLHAAQAASGKVAQELQPERFSFARTDRHTDDFPDAVRVYGHGDYHCNGHDAADLAHFHVRGVDPEIRPISFERSRKKDDDPFIDVGAKPRDLALGNARHPHRLHELVD